MLYLNTTPLFTLSVTLCVQNFVANRPHLSNL